MKNFFSNNFFLKKNYEEPKSKKVCIRPIYRPYTCFLRFLQTALEKNNCEVIIFFQLTRQKFFRPAKKKIFFINYFIFLREKIKNLYFSSRKQRDVKKKFFFRRKKKKKIYSLREINFRKSE